MKNSKTIKTKKIGIIGGVGPQATMCFYNYITKQSQRKYGAEKNEDYPYMIIESIPIPDFISNTEMISQSTEMLTKSVKILENAGAKKLCIACNTVHVLLNELQEKTNIEFISIIESVVKEVRNLEYKKVGVLASPVALKYGLYSQALMAEGIKPIIPDSNQQNTIKEIIGLIMAGEDNGKERKKYINILNDFIDKGAEGIILGCTELPLAINYEALGGRVINSMEVLAENIVDYYYRNN
ncbi:amino acid racemase [Candidatus Dojkabacteria bacterium]|nr:amino acid racemase [Candidatus Dojkabacteria bacterium]